MKIVRTILLRQCNFLRRIQKITNRAAAVRFIIKIYFKSRHFQHPFRLVVSYYYNIG